MNDAPFPNAPRIDAHDKVRGKALFGSDDARPGMVHAALAVATIGKGRITAIDTRDARNVPGVLLILTHDDFGAVKSPGFIMANGFGVQSLLPLRSPQIAYRGQPIALVAAESLEAAIEAAHLIEATYEEEPFSVTLDAQGTETINQADTPIKNFIPEVIVGDADAVFTDSLVTVEAYFTSPPQHQNPMELLASVAEWSEGTLTIHESTQNANAVRFGVATALGLAPENVVVISPYVGGGFGQKNSLQMQTVLAAVAAQRLRRPVKLVVPRAQVFHDASFRPASRHRVRLGADRFGGVGAQRDEIAVRGVAVHGQHSIGVIEQPVMRDAALVVAPDLRDRGGRAVRVADDLADPVGAGRERVLVRRRRHVVTTPAEEIGAEDATVEHDVDLRSDPPAARGTAATRAAIERDTDRGGRPALGAAMVDHRGAIAASQRERSTQAIRRRRRSRPRRRGRS